VTIILGINAYHADSSACIVIDGQLVAAAEEERFRRIKHWAGFPSEAVRYCLREAGVGLEEVDWIAINRNPKANLSRKILFTLTNRPSFSLVVDRLRHAAHWANPTRALADAFGVEETLLRPRLCPVEHHLAHLASSFLVSPFEEAAVVSVDGFGDFLSAMWGVGRGSHIEVRGRIFFPHSLGLFYQAITQYLGFWKYGDEYKVMGLAAYGEPGFLDRMHEIVCLNVDGTYKLALEYFRHHAEGVEMVWDGGEPVCGRIFTPKLEELLGPAREKDEPIGERHAAVAASLQAMYEQAFFHLLNHVQRETGLRKLALAGGCAMNSLANGKIFERTDFEDTYIQAAAGDAGGAIGAAFAVWHHELGRVRGFVMDRAYWGPAFSDAEIEEIVKRYRPRFEAEGCVIRRFDDEELLCEEVAERIAEGAVVGWFQGRMEWGPRALGNRSILCDPRRPDMKDILNRKIKRREPFRPFAPAILREHVAEWFETDYDVPFMLQVFRIRPEKRARIPAVTHVDGTGRLQTIRREQNPRYYRLIEAFYHKTGVPVVLNTSFNENEPVVCRPEEAIACFLRTKMDALVLGDVLIWRSQ